MKDAASRPSLSIGKLILVPAVITLAVTILRLVGELENWAPLFFNKHPGGGGALIGISWLPILFGPYFAWKLATVGEGPASTGKALSAISWVWSFSSQEVSLFSPPCATRHPPT
jgi:hypothetical protein